MNICIPIILFSRMKNTKEQVKTRFMCTHCSKSYRYSNGLEKHLKTCPKLEESLGKAEIKIKKNEKHIKEKRKGIDSKLRKRVWLDCIGDTVDGRCFCCWDKDIHITPFCGCMNTYQAGHIISHKNGGKAEFNNLLPICRDCNMKMSSENWDDYIERHSHLPLRVYGANPSDRVIRATVVIQSLCRMYLERKKPDSHWRIEWSKRWNRN